MTLATVCQRHMSSSPYPSREKLNVAPYRSYIYLPLEPITVSRQVRPVCGPAWVVFHICGGSCRVCCHKREHKQGHSEKPHQTDQPLFVPNPGLKTNVCTSIHRECNPSFFFFLLKIKEALVRLKITH